MVMACVDGFLYGVLRWWKGTLWAAILAHGFVDTVGFASYFLVGPLRAPVAAARAPPGGPAALS